MNLAALARGPLALLPALGGGLLMLGCLVGHDCTTTLMTERAAR